MIKITTDLMYKAFGFHLSSDIAMPELKIVTDSHIIADITIEKGDLTGLWEELAQPNKYFFIKEEFVMYWVPEVAIFSIKGGDSIVYSPLERAEEDTIRLYLLGSCMGAILMQRRILPLHGSAIAINGKAYAIVGDSGAGKSTLASAFLQKGYQLISDDVIPVTITDGIPMVTPAYPQQKLWLESLNHFGMNSDGLRPIIDRETKFAIPVEAQFFAEKLPLAGVFELVKTEGNEVELQPVCKLQRLHTLFYHTYRNFLIGPMGLLEWHFQTTAAFVNKIELYQLRRPPGQFTALELARLILSTIEEKNCMVAK